MAIIRTSAMREMTAEELDKKLRELNLELAKERGKIAVGMTVENSGRISEIRRTIARIHTIKAERAAKAAQKAPQKTETAPRPEKKIIKKLKGGMS